MSDIFDYLSLYLATLLLAVLKFTAFITCPWWVVFLPAGIGFCLFLYVAIAGR